MKIKLDNHMTETIIKMRKLAHMDWSCGTLHIAVCDGNLDDENIEFCLREWYSLDRKEHDNPRYDKISEEQKQLEWDLIQLLIVMSEEARYVCYWACENYDCLEVTDEN